MDLRKLFARKETALVPVPVRNGQFMQLLEPNGVLRGYFYKCDCGQEFHLTAAQAKESHVCVCKRPFSLMRFLVATSIPEWEAALAQLPVRALAKPEKQQPFYVVGDNEVDTGYERADPAGMF